MSEESVPVKQCPNNQRLEELTRSFEEEFGEEAQFVVRVPGRVNLIGEHVDYCGFPVLPMALQQDVLVAAAVESHPTPQLRLRNLNPKYANFDCVLARPQNIHFDSADGKPEWYNYVLCGIKGAMEYLEDLEDPRPKGMKVMVTGNIPPAAGLSSSSALVSASCLVFLHAHCGGRPVDKVAVAALSTVSERYIGTHGGGMDQAIAFLAKRGAAQYITWEPLVATPVPLPDDAVFVVAHSMTEANKAATSDFNQRVIECRLATAILAKLNDASSPKIRTLANVKNNLNISLTEMLNLANKQLQQDCYSKREVCDLLEMDETELNAKYLTENTTQLTHFKLRQRATHVLEEAIRVEKFRAVCVNAAKCEDGPENGRKACVIRSLGELMRSSHSSLDELYECSHPSLNRLVAISDEAGAHARLTGAGWGGCVVALCARAQVDHYLACLRKQYYSQVENGHQMFFTTSPNDGAEIYVLKSIYS